MNRSRIRGYWLLIFCVLITTSCDRSIVKPPPPSAPFPLIIGSDCSVDPEWRPVRIGQSVVWKAPTSNYFVRFNNHAPFGTSTGPASVDVDVDSPQPITGGRCQNPSSPTHISDCYFQYEVWEIKNGAKKKCGDPGIHVIQ